jgi:uncharacterized membrane protein YoaK (UPF0700 family)
MTTALIRPAPEVLSIRHSVSWLLFALSAGAVNAGAYLATERFVTHVTGIATTVGMDVEIWYLLMDYLLVLVSFIVGAICSVFAIQARTVRGKRPRPWAALLAVSAVLAGVAVAGHADVFGPIGGTVEEPADFAMLCLLAFSMGLMNSTVATSTAFSVRTTHMTGPSSDFGVHLGLALVSHGEERQTALRLAALRGGTIVAFIIGSALMVPLVKSLAHAAFLVPAALVVVGTLRSLIPMRGEVDRQAPQAQPAS